jgi:hypothetical protein
MSDDPAANVIIEEIHHAFQGVDRVQAMSWNQADVKDDYGMNSARFPDTDFNWEDLIEASWWYGDWCFGYLDPKGARYYLPAAMVCNLAGDYRVAAEHPLGKPEHTFGDVEVTLNESQVLAIRSFISYCVKISELEGHGFEIDRWIEIQGRWSSYYASS